jgi:hypothetical protein
MPSHHAYSPCLVTWVGHSAADVAPLPQVRSSLQLAGPPPLVLLLDTARRILSAGQAFS